MPIESDECVEHFLRHESAEVIARLARRFGIRHLDLVEESVQESLIQAFVLWRRDGVPENPTGWVFHVAKNRLIDELRRLGRERDVLDHIAKDATDRTEVERSEEDEQIHDDLLRMIFVCCHPTLDRASQIALSLKTLCGFNVREIAQGLLLNSETVKKRLQRGRQSLNEHRIEVELPAAAEIISRLNAVHQVLYVMFNEGYHSSAGATAIRDDICEEAVRLCHILCESSLATAHTRALLALQLFHSARLESRTGPAGELLLLEEQDRSKWDQSLIGLGRRWLERSKTPHVSPYHLEAAIAMQHCLAESMQDTDWPKIVQLYDRLIELSASPIYVLNHAIALGEAGNFEGAVKQLKRLADDPRMDHYLLFNCAFARLYELQDDTRSAARSYRAALEQSPTPFQSELIRKRLSRLATP